MAGCVALSVRDRAQFTECIQILPDLCFGCSLSVSMVFVYFVFSSLFSGTSLLSQRKKCRRKKVVSNLIEF